MRRSDRYMAVYDAENERMGRSVGVVEYGRARCSSMEVEAYQS